MKLYVVLEEVFGEYSAVAVFACEKKAQKYVDSHSRCMYEEVEEVDLSQY